MKAQTSEDLVARAHARFDELNAQDPRTILVDGVARPQELVFAERLDAWVRKVAPEAGLALRLAARCQHLARYSVPRSDYPEGRVAYLTWRKDLARMHADKATAILEELGAEPAVIDAVRAINLKQNLKGSPDVQAMEDALCLSFLEHELGAFADRHEDQMVVDIIRKTWRKMSEQGHQLASTLPLSGRALALVQRALADDGTPTTEGQRRP